MSSSSHPDPNKRRLLLRVLVKAMLWLSLLVGAWVIFTPLFKNKTPVNSKPVETIFEVADMNPGEVELVEWFGKPLIIAHRDAAQEQVLVATGVTMLRDPDSDTSVQPQSAKNALRSSTPGWFVSLGLGAGSGCALEFVPGLIAIGDGHGPADGFVDPCDSSRYDLAGRVLLKQSARKNTNIPRWRFADGRIIVSTEKP